MSERKSYKHNNMFRLIVLACSSTVFPNGMRSDINLSYEWFRMRRRRRLYAILVLIVSFVFVRYAFAELNIDMALLPGIFQRLLNTLSVRYFPPNMAHVLQHDYLRSVLKTLQMAYLAAMFGILVSVPVAWFAAFNVTPYGRFFYVMARLFVTGCRSVHAMIWTILIVAVLGYGFHSGVLALTLFCIGFTGKLFTEAVENIDRRMVDAIRSTGAGELAVFIYGVLPQIKVAWTGIAIYSWDVVFRGATVVGFFGGGGMGVYLRESLQMLALKDVAAILLSILCVVILSEFISAFVREKIAKSIA